ncbi:MAG: nucleotidyl transferase AbiEii/AbiGii toxin family protein [Alphaproteobacteria bacterium]|nr:nucleotidyl transferase AbiEii/AbiGii toxin family protein [Alphaproteobacteria bacterium]
MLQKQTVSPKLLELLDKLMNLKEFKEFILVGGTSLALQMGHRASIDIDLFGASNIDEELFTKTLKSLGQFEVFTKSKNILICSINGIKLDFVNYNYPLLQEILYIENIRMASKSDIAAMKLNAISGRGSKKDFIDLFFLLNDFSLQDMLDFYKQKYFDGSIFMVIKSLTYFNDADIEQTPTVFYEFNWENCKKKIIHEVKKLSD